MIASLRVSHFSGPRDGNGRTKSDGNHVVKEVPAPTPWLQGQSQSQQLGLQVLTMGYINKTKIN